MHSKVPINVASADVNVVPKIIKTTDAGSSSPDIQLRYSLNRHINMFGKDIGTVVHPKTGDCDFCLLGRVFKHNAVGAIQL